HTDKRYKDSLLQTMIHRAYSLSSTTEAFNAECAKLRSIFSRLDYPLSVIDSAIKSFFLNSSADKAERNNDDSSTLRDLSHKIGPTLQPVFVSKKLGQDLRPKEIKPSIVNKQCVVYQFSCDLRDADYVGYTARHLHQRIAEHKNSAIGRHFLEAHGNNNLLRESQFTVLRKCQSKFDCLVFEMLFIKKLKPNLNIQTDSIRAKLFV
ncbi:unnamed protein product, partial [Porites lobata]